MFEFKTTFWSDFSIADRFGIKAIRDTYKRAFECWRENVEYMAELVIVLNHKIWQFYETRPEIAEVYNELWEKADNYCVDNFTGEERQYYWNVTD